MSDMFCGCKYGLSMNLLAAAARWPDSPPEAIFFASIDAPWLGAVARPRRALHRGRGAQPLCKSEELVLLGVCHSEYQCKTSLKSGA